MSAEYLAFRELLSDRPVVFHPSLARLFGGINEALFFQQIAYWSGKGDDPEWIYKTREELEAETCLSRYQQEQARKKLIKLGVLEEVKRGLPAKLYYRINWPRVIALYGASGEGGNGSPARMRETDILAGKDVGNSPTRMRETRHQAGEEVPTRGARSSPAITEITSEITQRDVSPTNENAADDSPPIPTTPEERLAYLEAQQAQVRQLRAARGLR